MSIVGKFLFISGQLYVIVLKAVDLDLKTIHEEPGVHNLPITPLFTSFCAPCVAEAMVTDHESNFFVLGKKVYNPFTSSSEDVEIPCVYDLSNPRFSAIVEASKRSPIFSAAGELFIGENLAQIICAEVEWTSPKVKHEQGSPARSMRRQKFLSIEDKYIGKKSNNRHKVNNSSSSSS
ncbi:506_t:CDS:2 [Entrophospora sp. SA101]|nr:506_t:CDS:2 [Entrophospora sp. SA101]